MSAIDWARRFPSINWAEPIEVVWPHGRFYACRICIAEKGLTATSAYQWEHRPAAQIHIDNMHPKARQRTP